MHQSVNFLKNLRSCIHVLYICAHVLIYPSKAPVHILYHKNVIVLCEKVLQPISYLIPQLMSYLFVIFDVSMTFNDLKISSSVYSIALVHSLSLYCISLDKLRTLTTGR